MLPRVCTNFLQCVAWPPPCMSMQIYTCQLFLILMREIFFRVQQPPEKSLGPSSKGTGASTNDAESLPLRGCFARFSHVSCWKCIVSSRSGHLLIPHQSLLIQILQFLFDFDRKSAVLMSRFNKSAECFSMWEISPHMRETWDFSSYVGDLAALQIVHQNRCGMLAWD